MDQPLAELDETQWRSLMHGTGDATIAVAYESRSGRSHRYDISWEGVVPNLERRYKETDSEWVRSDIERYMVAVPCPECGGARLKREMRAVDVDGRSIVDVARLAVTDGLEWTQRLRGDH